MRFCVLGISYTLPPPLLANTATMDTSHSSLSLFFLAVLRVETPPSLARMCLVGVGGGIRQYSLLISSLQGRRLITKKQKKNLVHCNGTFCTQAPFATVIIYHYKASFEALLFVD